MCVLRLSWKPSGHQMAVVISYDGRGDMVVSSTSQVASQLWWMLSNNRLGVKGQATLCVTAITTVWHTRVGAPGSLLRRPHISCSWWLRLSRAWLNHHRSCTELLLVLITVVSYLLSLVVHTLNDSVHTADSLPFGVAVAQEVERGRPIIRKSAVWSQSVLRQDN